tara:strand:- start:333 stop:554 length:222 start_codon:yes stop_codon:yes gene_type:complete
MCNGKKTVLIDSTSCDREECPGCFGVGVIDDSDDPYNLIPDWDDCYPDPWAGDYAEIIDENKDSALFKKDWSK